LYSFSPGTLSLFLLNPVVEAHPSSDHLEVSEFAEAHHRLVPDLGAEPQDLLDHLLHEVLAADAVGETGVVVYPVSLDSLASDLPAIQHQRLEVVAGCVEGGGEPSWARSHHYDVIDLL
jgi:hypothetical protein